MSKSGKAIFVESVSSVNEKRGISPAPSNDFLVEPFGVSGLSATTGFSSAGFCSFSEVSSFVGIGVDSTFGASFLTS